jgi:hypothetical protein
MTQIARININFICLIIIFVLSVKIYLICVICVLKMRYATSLPVTCYLSMFYILCSMFYLLSVVHPLRGMFGVLFGSSIDMQALTG